MTEQKNIKLEEITTLSSEEFNTNFSKLLKRVEKDPAFLKQLKEHPIEQLETAHIPIKPSVKITVATNDEEYKNAPKGHFLLVMGKISQRKNLDVAQLEEVSGGGLIAAIGGGGLGLILGNAIGAEIGSDYGDAAAGAKIGSIVGGTAGTIFGAILPLP